MTVYKNLQFSTHVGRPYFFSNFVTSIDGRSAIKHTNAYLPIGSKTDFDTFIDLRTYADALIHGKHTAAGHRTVETIAQRPFLRKRVKRGKPEILPYFIVTNNPDISILPALLNSPMQKPYIVTHKKAKIVKDIEKLAFILRFGENTVNLQMFSKYLYQQGYKHTLVEGGATLMGSFLSENLIDEVFLTIAPKILSGTQTEFFTMTEGNILPVKNVMRWKLVSLKAVESELFLRYRK